ncbi:hypothetical protein [Flammeovirga aprica]|uniref:Uncharacterized protein n=1 Tax=Flammeovirga aprica JL-4 TaxID=694437 RepID=A0A7X9P1K1_9BACT|nr:hypothetical protein [Flammeovirga aprica]NME67610.1 hypothetical protein [Flammeovirga aprica JL-4]
MEFLTLFPSRPGEHYQTKNGRKPTGANVKRKRHSCPTDHQKSPDF